MVVARFCTLPCWSFFPFHHCIHCPSRWHFFLRRPFWTNLSLSNAHNQRDKYLLRNIRSQLPQWIQSEYSWGLDFRTSTLSKGCILPKPSRQLGKARPIVDYSSAWAKKLGGAVSTVLIEILKSVFRFILEFEHVHHIIHGITRLFSSESFAESGYVFQHTDIAGFYDRVEHGRMIAAVEFVMYTYASYAMKQNKDGIRFYKSTIWNWNEIFAFFKGTGETKWNSIFMCFHQNNKAFTGFSSILLDHSYFTVASQILRQCRGASMDPNLLCWVARFRLIHHHVFPGELQTAQIQDLLLFATFNAISKEWCSGVVIRFVRFRILTLRMRGHVCVCVCV